MLHKILRMQGAENLIISINPHASSCSLTGNSVTNSFAIS